MLEFIYKWLEVKEVDQHFQESYYSLKLFLLYSFFEDVLFLFCPILFIAINNRGAKQTFSLAVFILLLCLKIFFSQFLVYWNYCFVSFSFPTSSTLCYSSNIFEHLLFGDAGINKMDPILAILKLPSEWKKIHNKLTNTTANNCGNF